MPPTIADTWKLRALLDPQSLGKVDAAGMTIRLNPEVVAALQQAKKEQQGADADGEEHKSAAAAPAADEQCMADQPYSEQLPSPAHQVSSLPLSSLPAALFNACLTPLSLSLCLLSRCIRFPCSLR